MSDAAAFMIAGIYFNARGWYVHSALCAVGFTLLGVLRIIARAAV